MKSALRPSPFAAAAAALLAVGFAACDSNRRAATPSAAPSVPITAANAFDVARAAWRTTFDPVRVAFLAVGFLAEERPQPTEPPPPPQRVNTREFDGPDGGTAVFTWGDADLDGEYSSGDEFVVVFADYSAAGRVLTGIAAFDDVVVDGNLPEGLAWIVDARLEMNGLRYESGDQTATINGSFRCHRERRVTVDLLRLDLLADLQIGAATVRSGTTLSRDDFTQAFSMVLGAEGSLFDALLGGELAVRTDAPLTGLSFLPDPQMGEFVVTGGNGATVTIAPLDFSNVELRIDENGDGEVDQTLSAEWTSF